MTTPAYLYNLHKCLIITVDVVFVNENAFMILSERRLKFMNVDHIKFLNQDSLLKALYKVINYMEEKVSLYM